MNTKLFDLTIGLDKVASEAAEILKNGGIVAFPTETVYGIGANPFNLDAVKKIYYIKGRNSDNPLIFHVSKPETIYEIAEVPTKVEKIIKNFMPGPLTLVLKSKIDKKFTFGLETIAVRIPDNLIALRLIDRFSLPIVAPSANISGKPSGTHFKHVVQDFLGKVDVIIDGGHTVYGIESTVIDVTSEPFLLLRPGAFSFEELQEVGVDIVLPHKKEMLKRSPGTRYRHYAPNAVVISVQYSDNFSEIVSAYKGRNIAYIGINDPSFKFAKTFIFNDIYEYARLLFSTFRYLDAIGIEIILAELPEKSGIGVAVADRITRASEKR